MTLQIEISNDLVESTVRGIMENFPEASVGSSLMCIGWKYDEMEFLFKDGEENKQYTLNKEKLLATFPLLFTDKWPKGCTAPPRHEQL